MSDQNVDIARRLCEAAWHRPAPDVDTLNELAHPDHELVALQSLLEGGGYVGAKGFREWLGAWAEMFGEEWECPVNEATAIDDESVLVSARLRARGVTGGVPVEQDIWVTMTVRDGLVTRSAVYTSREQAVEATQASE